MARRGLYERAGKRALDILLAGGALLALSPLLAAVAAAIRLHDRGPAIFRQNRIGRDGVTFTLLKFRSMPVNTGDLTSDAARHVKVTPVGRVIRRTNIDELPQLINILLGNMSIVGPRPAIMSQRELVELRRDSGALRCTPGLTGLAQINAYDGMPVGEKARWDAEYARSVSLSQDLRIIARTVGYLKNPPPTY